MNDQAEEAVEETEEYVYSDDESTDDVDEQNDIDADDSEEDDLSDDDSEIEEEFEEVDINGKSYRIPKDLKSNIMMQQDYTRKTQEVAEQRKALESEQGRIRNIEASQRQHFKTYAEITSIDAQLAEYKEVDWNAAYNENPQLAQQHQFRHGQLEKERSEKENTLRKQESQVLNEQHSRIAQQLEQSQRRLASEIKGWSGDTAKNVASKASELGFTKDFLHALNSGVFPDAVPMIKALHKAAEYDKMVSSAKKIQKNQPIDIKPTRRVKGGNSSVRKDIYSPNLSAAERISLYKKASKK
jgi:hypothetical protein